MSIIILIVIALAALLFFSSYTIRSYERGVVLRFGVYKGMKEARLRFIIPFVDELTRVVSGYLDLKI